jgi:hypothetical protein
LYSFHHLIEYFKRVKNDRYGKKIGDNECLYFKRFDVDREISLQTQIVTQAFKSVCLFLIVIGAHTSPGEVNMLLIVV